MENKEEITNKEGISNTQSIPNSELSFIDTFKKFQVELAYSEEKGRYMVASRNLARGSIVYMGDPYTFVVNPKWWRSICHNCLQPHQNLSSCASCHQTFYCSKECQKSAWRIHKEECKIFKRIFDPSYKGDKSLPSSQQIVLRLIISKLRENKEAVPVSPNFEDVRKYISNKEKRSSEKLKEFHENTKKLFGLLLLDINENKELFEAAELMFCQATCNSFGIFNMTTNQVASGLYPQASFFNNSCNPNCVVSFLGPRLYIRTIENVFKGTELSIAYVDTNQPSQIRRALLQRDYFFDCNCSKCSLPWEKSFDKYLVGFRCKNKECIEPLVNEGNEVSKISLRKVGEKYVCHKCQWSTSKTELIAKLEKIRDLHKESQSQFEKDRKNLQQSYKIMGDVIRTAEELLHKYHRDLYDFRVSQINFSTLLTKELEAVDLLEKTMDFVIHASGRQIQSLVAYSLFMMGNLLLQAGGKEGVVNKDRYLKILECYTKALQIYTITHGTEIPFVKGLISKINEFEDVCKTAGFIPNPVPELSE